MTSHQSVNKVNNGISVNHKSTDNLQKVNVLTIMELQTEVY
jgi:hypothetical protein